MNSFEYRESPLRQNHKRPRETTDPLESNSSLLDGGSYQVNKMRLIERIHYVDRNSSIFGSINETSFNREAIDNKIDIESEKRVLA